MERRDLWWLPRDLRAMGWQLVSAREVPRSPAPTWYTVGYARPIERGIDDQALTVHGCRPPASACGPGYSPPALSRGMTHRAPAGGARLPRN
jgi:hypothetical protein